MYVLAKQEIEDGTYELLLNGRPIASGSLDTLKNFGENIVNLCEDEGDSNLVCG